MFAFENTQGQGQTYQAVFLMNIQKKWWQLYVIILKSVEVIERGQTYCEQISTYRCFKTDFLDLVFPLYIYVRKPIAITFCQSR